MTAEGPLSAHYRIVRAVRAPEDGPWPGRLVRAASGETGVLVDAAVLGSAWSGWDAAAGGHILTPLDIVRRIDGHDVLLPVCTEPLEAFLRRRAIRMPVGAGEAVTLAVSVLRGCAELAATPEIAGEWWLDDTGRPVLASELSSRRALDAAAEALRSVVVDARLERVWDLALRAISAQRVSARELLDAEDALFAAAAPEPLTTVTLSPRSAVDAAPTSRDTAAAVAAEPPRSTWQTLVGHVDADFADTLSRVTTGIWRRARARERPRRAPWVVGGAVAAAVLAGGALWPAAGGEITEGEAAPTAPAVEPAPTGPAGAGAATEESVPETAPDATTEAPAQDLAAVGAALLTERLACGDDETCLARVLSDPSTPLGSGAIDLAASERVVTLLDDFGDVAVLRVDAADESLPAQLAVLVRQDEEWLLRDVHDVAQQP
ncbi:hypothetical protein K0817_009835 [Microbacterium sp. HD4P20]|uniref:hypothetical protein n=1 Tax=Microbacterium sp. HD4P20 TaxID=2864874 RepID=UPI001C63F219|nr:hypothetical protein [Microbacterium sp. HD4P20]MCP2636859.1 hypothetical protein [Microbacterium sp. HD4P20]